MHVTKSPRLPPPLLHTVSYQKLDSGEGLGATLFFLLHWKYQSSFESFMLKHLSKHVQTCLYVELKFRKNACHISRYIEQLSFYSLVWNYN